jgi:hypothetical protein
LDEAQLAELYPLVTTAKDALGELAEALEQCSTNGLATMNSGKRRLLIVLCIVCLAA